MTCICIIVAVKSVPLGFVDELFVSAAHKTANLLTNTGAFAKDAHGNVLFFLGSKEGMIRVMVNPPDGDYDDIDDVKSFSTIMELPVCNDGERGVQSILPHPDFETNGYLYIYRTEKVGECKLDYKEGPNNRLSRFTVVSSGDGTPPTIDPKSEVSLFRGPTQGGKNHNGGGMAFGNDGFLYITIGDGGSTADKYAQNLRTLNGKVLR